MAQTSYDLSDAGSPKYAMTQFTTDEFLKFWPLLEDMLDKLPHTWRHWTKEHIYRTITNDLMQVWGIGAPPNATLILFTTVNVYPSMRMLSIPWAAGTFNDEMIPLIDAALTGYARLNNCEEIEIRGRLGWEPKLKKVGFTHHADVWTRHVSSVILN